MGTAKSMMLAVVAFIGLPVSSIAQSTLNFPRVVQLEEMTTTGFAVVNPTSTNTTVTFTLYTEEGHAKGTSPQTVPARGQLARLANELFPGATEAGWVQATSAAAGLHGFWFGGDFATFADGAEAATPATELVLPLITPFSEIHIANTGATDVTILLNLLGTDGADLVTPFPQRIPARGFFKSTMVGIFPVQDDFSLPSHMRITCKCKGSAPVAATVVARNFLSSPSSAVSNGIPASTPATTIYFPHLVQGPQDASNWISLVGLTNLSATSDNDVTLTFISESGALVRNNQFTLPPNGGSRYFARDLFALTTGFENGWVRVTSNSGLPITGYIAYADTAARGVAVVAPQIEAQPSLLFAHIADLPPWLTGLALLNANTAAANIEVFAMRPNGTLIGRTSISLPPGTSTARLLRDFIPQMASRTSDGGFVFVRSDVPVYGIELFFSRDLQVLANVAASPGNTFVPPQ